MLGRGLATGSLTLLLALAGTAEARGHDEGQGDETRGEHAPEREPGAETSAATHGVGGGLGVGEPEPGSACRPQC